MEYSDQISCSVVSHSLRPHEPQGGLGCSITNSQSSLKLTSIESVMPSHSLLWLPGSRAQAQQLWDLVASRHVESSWIRD